MIGSVNIKSKRKLKSRYKVLIFIFTITFIVVNSVEFYFGNLYYEKVCKMYFDRANTGLSYYKSSFDYNRFEDMEKYDVTVNSNFGYKLEGTYIFNPKPTKNTVIIVHGVTGNRWESMKYADMYLDLGFNVFVYDSRYHGNSGGKDISLGFFEKYDLDNVVKWVKWVNKDGTVGVHGESLGAVTALLQADLDQNTKNVSFYVTDCPYSDLPELFSLKFEQYSKVSLPTMSKSVLFYGNIIALIKSGFSFYAISPIKVIKNVKAPVMFIHGSNDTLIPASMSLDMYLAKKGPKYIYIAPNAEHAFSYLVNKDEYRAKVSQFLKDNEIIK